MSLYEKYGGFATISKIVHTFYDRVLESPIVAGYFDGVSMDRLIDHQTKFFCKILEGPDDYDGRSLEAAHRHLGITDEAFDEVATILLEVLDDAGVESDDCAAIAAILASVRPQIVTRPQAQPARP